MSNMSTSGEEVKRLLAQMARSCHAGDLEHALALVEAALKLAPRHATALCNKAPILSNMGRRDEADQAWRTALQLNPTDSHAKETMSRIEGLARSQQPRRALVGTPGSVAFEHEAAHWVAGAGAVVLGKTSANGTATSGRIAPHSPVAPAGQASDVDRIVAEALERYQLGRRSRRDADFEAAYAKLSEAVELLRASRREVPLEVNFAQGSTCLFLRRFQEALTHFERARSAAQAQNRPYDVAQALRHRGMALELQGRLPEALSAFSAARAMFLELGALKEATEMDEPINRLGSAGRPASGDGCAQPPGPSPTQSATPIDAAGNDETLVEGTSPFRSGFSRQDVPDRRAERLVTVLCVTTKYALAGGLLFFPVWLLGLMGIAAIISCMGHVLKIQGDRWPSMAEAADALIQAYRKATGKQYTRGRPRVLAAISLATAQHDRRAKSGLGWTDPRQWLERACKAAGQSLAEAGGLIRDRKGSRQAQAIEDLIIYQQALDIYSRLAASGRKEMDEEIARLCEEKAVVHESAGDVPGAVAMYGRAVDCYEGLVFRDARQELAHELARVCMNQARATVELGDYASASNLYDRAIRICERLFCQQGRAELAHGLALCYVGRGHLLQDLGDLGGGAEMHQKAIEVYEQAVFGENRWAMAGYLAHSYMSRAACLRDLGYQQAAVELFGRAREVYEHAVCEQGREDLADSLACCYGNEAVARSALGDHRTATQFLDRAIGIRERLVYQQGRWECADGLAFCYMRMAVEFGDLGDRPRAAPWFDRAIDVYERLVNKQGRRELRGDLARCYSNKALTVAYLGDYPAALGLYQRAIEIREQLV